MLAYLLSCTESEQDMLYTTCEVVYVNACLLAITLYATCEVVDDQLSQHSTSVIFKALLQCYVLLPQISKNRPVIDDLFCLIILPF